MKKKKKANRNELVIRSLDSLDKILDFNPIIIDVNKKKKNENAMERTNQYQHVAMIRRTWKRNPQKLVRIRQELRLCPCVYAFSSTRPCWLFLQFNGNGKRQLQYWWVFMWEKERTCWIGVQIIKELIQLQPTNLASYMG